jgi:hypothetical protein
MIRSLLLFSSDQTRLEDVSSLMLSSKTHATDL